MVQEDFLGERVTELPVRTGRSRGGDGLENLEDREQKEQTCHVYCIFKLSHLSKSPVRLDVS